MLNKWRERQRKKWANKKRGAKHTRHELVCLCVRFYCDSIGKRANDFYCFCFSRQKSNVRQTTHAEESSIRTFKTHFMCFNRFQWFFVQMYCTHSLERNHTKCDQYPLHLTTELIASSSHVYFCYYYYHFFRLLFSFLLPLSFTQRLADSKQYFFRFVFALAKLLLILSLLKLNIWTTYTYRFSYIHNIGIDVVTHSVVYDL